MKRTNDDVVGGPKVRNLRRDVAGARRPTPILDVASFRHALDDPMGEKQDDAELLAEFADFMIGDSETDLGELLPPDPVFRERLLRRLWRTHVMAHLRDRGETH